MSSRDLITYRLKRAKDTILEAEKMAEMEHWNTCINRLYYACFYAVNALLAANELFSTKHSGVMGLFNLHYIKTGIIVKSSGRLFKKLFIYCQQSDYEDFFTMDGTDILPLITQTKEFVSNIEMILQL